MSTGSASQARDVRVAGRPLLPAFDNADDEVAHVKRRLAATFRLFAERGLDEGVLGHISARDPRDPELFWLNPFGRHFALVRAADLILVDAAGTVREGKGLVNPAAVITHAALYAHRPDVKAIAHAHSFWGKVWSTARRPLPPMTQEACTFYDDHVVVDMYQGVISDAEEGRHIAQAMGPTNAAILVNHGLLTVGSTVDAAAWRYVLLEKCCEAQASIERLGAGEPIGAEVAARTRATVGSEYACWAMFQPLYRWTESQCPDL